MSTYAPNARARCPHCLTVVRFEKVTWRNQEGGHYGELPNHVVSGPTQSLLLILAACPDCGKVVVTLKPGEWLNVNNFALQDQEFTVWPLATSRPPVPKDVPAALAADYNEAALVLSLSPKASAALSRRCLQALLREQKHNEKDLWKQIDAALPELPGYIGPHLDHVRVIGNFAAHPMKSTASGEIVDVEPGEAV